MIKKSFQNTNTLLFDLDGTLLDSFPVHIEVFRKTFAQFGIHLTEENFLSAYSPNWYKTYELLGLKIQDWVAADTFWLKEVEKHSAKLFPGVEELLLKLGRRFTLGLVTSGSKIRVERDLDSNRIKHFFKVIVTGDDVHIPKPSPEALELALKKLIRQTSEAIYIGDSPADYEMAKSGAVRFIGVSSAFNINQPEHQEFRINSITELPELLGIED